MKPITIDFHKERGREMGKGKSEVPLLVDAINKVDEAEKSWPDGYANPFIRDGLSNLKKDFQDRLVQLLSEKQKATKR